MLSRNHPHPVQWLVVTAAAVAALSACSRPDESTPQVTQSTVSEPEHESTVQQAPAAAPAEFYVGDTLSDGKVQVTLREVKTGTSIGGQFGNTTAAEGGEYVVVIVKEKNIGTAPITAFDMPSINLFDPQGNKYSADITASGAAASAFGDDSKILSDLNPGISTTSVKAFEVGKDAFDLSSWRLRVAGDIRYHLLPQQSAAASVAKQEVTPTPPNTSDNEAQSNPAEPTQTADQEVAKADAASMASPDCSTVEACLGESINSAKSGDIDGIRHIAAIIDSFPKPDLGNKALAADLNSQALTSIKEKDYAAAMPILAQAYTENPRSTEIAANYAFVLTRNGDAQASLPVFYQAVKLDPRRTSTWVPYAEALANTGRKDDAIAALWVAYQWSSNRDKTIDFYQAQAAAQPVLVTNAVYAAAVDWVKDGHKPTFSN